MGSQMLIMCDHKKKVFLQVDDNDFDSAKHLCERKSHFLPIGATILKFIELFSFTSESYY